MDKLTKKEINKQIKTQTEQKKKEKQIYKKLFSKLIKRVIQLLCFKFIFIFKNITMQNKQIIFTLDQVQNLRYQCTFLNQNLSLMRQYYIYYSIFLNIEKKYLVISYLEGKYAEKYQLIRNELLIDNKRKNLNKRMSQINKKTKKERKKEITQGEYKNITIKQKATNKLIKKLVCFCVLNQYLY
ncbi:hypothetical protein TTHERM_001181993 (macronuclear) [Tetrahymena thermophila SB210]|uniref:Uncharacterized protein n=1 Tax=Tetrahymena thermophila (strain SB210) TaxID=312017 RepID=W7X962_TETTS|nr:hypothetical protein TTHERM_001181993 [Tetrahymena thermophila SB210]EWS72918.1 hypothetical protein TTHERM_001181993 [Tetrahymena thermophila SB210]|eukprot:XP_012654544.1 hypothetical protein TTHERM_001181993 [Tetrahymena thermophila SB210]